MRKILVDPAGTGKFTREICHPLTEKLRERMYDLLHLMFAENRRSLLIVLHGIDASGKDGTVRNIFSGANPQGIRVYSFKKPSAEELAHDFLWRCHRLAPERGSTAIFNRSYYEDVSTVKVNPKLLEERNLGKVNLRNLFRDRYRQINDFERMLVENETVVLKFFLHISKEEQKERFKERLRDASKHWKFSAGDLEVRKVWHLHQRAFAEMIAATDTKLAPWHIIPADKKWYRNYLVVEQIVAALEAKKMKFPALSGKAPEFQ
jgi:PPK2 family polyphosphate:nucleotide phosphotransferase